MRRWGKASAPRHEPPSDADATVVRQVLGTLSTTEREVLVLRFYADLKVDDIAQQLGLPVGTVKSHIHRGLARMREELA